jgi:hypothetical protein
LSYTYIYGAFGNLPECRLVYTAFVGQTGKAPLA